MSERRLDATRVLVVNPRFISTAPLDDRASEDLFPGPLFLLGKTLNALLLDRMSSSQREVSPPILRDVHAA